MELWLSKHAEERMADYAISTADIGQVLSQNNISERTETVVVYDGLVGSRRIRVVVGRDSEPPLIVTVMLTRRGYRRRG